MTWQSQVPGGFGNQDVIFANHPSDEQGAKDSIKNAKEAGASKDDFRKEAIWHVYKNVTNPSVRQELFEQLEKKIESLWK